MEIEAEKRLWRRTKSRAQTDTHINTTQENKNNQLINNNNFNNNNILIHNNNNNTYDLPLASPFRLLQISPSPLHANTTLLYNNIIIINHLNNNNINNNNNSNDLYTSVLDSTTILDSLFIHSPNIYLLLSFNSKTIYYNNKNKNDRNKNNYISVLSRSYLFIRATTPSTCSFCTLSSSG